MICVEGYWEDMGRQVYDWIWLTLTASLNWMNCVYQTFVFLPSLFEVNPLSHEQRLFGALLLLYLQPLLRTVQCSRDKVTHTGFAFPICSSCPWISVIIVDPPSPSFSRFAFRRLVFALHSFSLSVDFSVCYLGIARYCRIALYNYAICAWLRWL